MESRPSCLFLPLMPAAQFAKYEKGFHLICGLVANDYMSKHSSLWGQYYYFTAPISILNIKYDLNLLFPRWAASTKCHTTANEKR